MKNMYEGVDTESELFACLFLLEKGAFHFDSLGDPDYTAIREHLDKLGIPHELKFGNRISLYLKVCTYCNGSGYDSYPNHDTTIKPCPKCNN